MTGHHWIKRPPKDRFLRTVLDTAIVSGTKGQLVARTLECGHTNYSSSSRASNLERKTIRCRVCINEELADHRARSRRPSPAERIIDDYVAGRTSGGVMSIARMVIHLETPT